MFTASGAVTKRDVIARYWYTIYVGLNGGLSHVAAPTVTD